MSLAVGRPVASRIAVSKCPQRGIHRQAVFPSAADLTVTQRPQLRLRQASRADDSGIVATVFGCTGFLGRYVVALLGRIGSQVICPYRGDGMNARHLKLAGELGQIVPVPFRPQDDESIYRAVERSNVVINLIGQDRPTRNFTLDNAHVDIPRKIAQISKESGAQRFISMSALGADPASISAWLASKGKGEIAIREAFPDATIFRTCSLFGRNDRFLNLFARLAYSFPLIPLVDGGSQKLQPVAVENAAQAVVSSLSFQDAIGATYELGGPNVFTFEELTELVYKHTGLDSNTVPLPLAVARLYGSLISFLPANMSPLTADQVVRSTLDSLVSSQPTVDGVKTFADLNMNPTSLYDVANQVLSIYKKNFETPADIKY